MIHRAWHKGWLLIWKLFLRQIPFFRALFGLPDINKKKSDTSTARIRRDSGSRHRQQIAQTAAQLLKQRQQQQKARQKQ